MTNRKDQTFPLPLVGLLAGIGRAKIGDLGNLRRSQQVSTFEHSLSRIRRHLRFD